MKKWKRFFSHEKKDETGLKQRTLLQGLIFIFQPAGSRCDDKGEIISNEMYERTPTDLSKEPLVSGGLDNEGIG